MDDKLTVKTVKFASLKICTYTVFPTVHCTYIGILEQGMAKVMLVFSCYCNG